MVSDPEYSAMLLIGPTGSGKTPFGEYLAAHGFEGRNCFHFDFGGNLRAAACGEYSELLSSRDADYIKNALEKGLLLENETFHIAAGLFRAFIQRGQITPADLIILNGLPRHVGQADDVGRLVRVCRLAFLDCAADVVRERISLNSGGDRTDRLDDSIDDIEKKLQIFRDRTIPLLDYYRTHGVPIERICVRRDDTATTMYEKLVATKRTIS